jgi:hypothetical protein
MKKIHIVGLALVAVFAVSAFAASSAFALESVWLVEGLKLTTAAAVDSSGKLILTDDKGGPFGEKVEVECEGTDQGTVGPGISDKLTNVLVTGCKTLSGGCEKPNAEANNLPWNTTIELIGGVFYDDIKAGTGNVAYTVFCTFFGVPGNDTCEIALGRTLLENGAGGTVNAVFNKNDPNQPPATCSRGGAGEGLVDGTDNILSTEGLALAVSEG